MSEAIKRKVQAAGSRGRVSRALEETGCCQAAERAAPSPSAPAKGVARAVKNFWLKVNKIVLFKHKNEMDKTQQEAMDKQLNFMVGQTERYSRLLVQKIKVPEDGAREEGEGKGDEVGKTGADETADGDSVHSSEDDSEFSDVQAEADDETTLMEEERDAVARGDDGKSTLAELEEEANMSLDALRAMYSAKVSNQSLIVMTWTRKAM